MLELYQAEWCPASSRVRERLTELGLDYVVRQVPVDRDKRTALVAATGTETIPALLLEDGTAVVTEDAIQDYLDRHFAAPPDSEAHRLKAAKIRRAYLDEECDCPAGGVRRSALRGKGAAGRVVLRDSRAPGRV